MGMESVSECIVLEGLVMLDADLISQSHRPFAFSWIGVEIRFATEVSGPIFTYLIPRLRGITIRKWTPLFSFKNNFTLSLSLAISYYDATTFSYPNDCDYWRWKIASYWAQGNLGYDRSGPFIRGSILFKKGMATKTSYQTARI